MNLFKLTALGACVVSNMYAAGETSLSTMEGSETSGIKTTVQWTCKKDRGNNKLSDVSHLDLAHQNSLVPVKLVEFADFFRVCMSFEHDSNDYSPEGLYAQAWEKDDSSPALQVLGKKKSVQGGIDQLLEASETPMPSWKKKESLPWAKAKDSELGDLWLFSQGD